MTNMLDNKFDPKTTEQRLYKMWEEAGHFKPRAAKPSDTKADNFSIVIPPPNVTGSLHMGHAVNNTIQDILVRYHRMTGKAVLWQPGTDHAGIATQMVVERKLAGEGKARKDMTREQFLEHVWAWKAESGGNINQQLRRLGSSCDWSREKFTLGNPDDENDKMAEAVTKAFVEMYEAGLIYRDKRLVNWDPHFQTAISDLEVETKTVDGHYWHLRYPLADGVTYEHPIKDEDGNVTGHETRGYVVVATSRPETMLGDTGVAVHPDDERYSALVGKEVILPIVGRRVPIIEDDYADPEKGSGAVKITPAHDFNDYEVGKRAGHEPLNILDEKARIVGDGAGDHEVMPHYYEDYSAAKIPAEYGGLNRFVARKKIVAFFETENLLDAVEDLKIEQPFGDRSNVVVEPWLTDQWYVDAEKLAEQAIAKVEDGSTRIIPENWKKTYDHWMKDIQPWCISRQLWWGHQIPVWYGPRILDDGSIDPFPTKEDCKVFVASSEEGAIELAKSFYKINVGVSTVGLTVNAFALNPAKKDDEPSVLLERDEDVLDTWFSSGLWPFSTLGWPDDPSNPENEEDMKRLTRFYPTSVLVTAFDIIFFWVARMMMQGLHFMDEVPFKDVYIHALVLDEAGKKMSKSIGNTLDPLDLIDGVSVDDLVAKRSRGLKNPDKAPQIAKATRKQYPDGFEAYGADALRFTLASMAGQGRNIRLSVDRIAGYRNFGTKLWSAASFGQMNDCALDASFAPESAALPINKWIISETARTAAEVTRCIEAYRFNDASDAAYKFVWDTFCSWYLELTKPLLSGDDGADKDETRATFAWVLDQILKLLHPFMPFITEELWANTSANRASHLIVSAWPQLSDSLVDEAAVAEVEWLQTLITNIRSVRADMNIPPSKKAPLLMLAGELDARLAAYAPQLSPMARVENVELASESPKGALQTVVDGVTYAIPLDGLIDLGAEKARLEKEIAKAKDEIEKIDKKLSNPAFTDKAPEKVVNLQKERRAGYADEVAKLEEAISGLG